MQNYEKRNYTEEDARAGILIRVIARIIDLIIAGALFEIVPKAGFFAGIAYLLIADGLFDGRSIGKKLIGLRVVLIGSGDICGYRESILRNFIFAISFLLFVILREVPILGIVLSVAIPIVILSVEGLILLGSENGMRFGDEVAKTRVMEVKEER
jgi:uncharacterized RDD family membrane protein YckC